MPYLIAALIVGAIIGGLLVVTVQAACYILARSVEPERWER